MNQLLKTIGVEKLKANDGYMLTKKAQIVFIVVPMLIVLFAVLAFFSQSEFFQITLKNNRNFDGNAFDIAQRQANYIIVFIVYIGLCFLNLAITMFIIFEFRTRNFLLNKSLNENIVNFNRLRMTRYEIQMLKKYLFLVCCTLSNNQSIKKIPSCLDVTDCIKYDYFMNKLFGIILLDKNLQNKTLADVMKLKLTEQEKNIFIDLTQLEYN